MKFLAVAFMFLFIASNETGAEWYKNLFPGVTRTEIQSLAGTPSSSSGVRDRYDLGDTYLEFFYNNDGTLARCDHRSAESHIGTYYYIIDAPLTSWDVWARKFWLEAKEYIYLPRFAGPFIRANRYYGNCYQIDNSFVVVQPVLGLSPSNSFFYDKSAKVTLIDAKHNETVLYRAIDNWEKLRPPQLSPKQVEERTIRLRTLKASAIGKSMKEVFGKPDGVFGSGIHYEVFYLQDALAVVRSLNTKIIENITISRPGAEAISFEKWFSEK